MILCITAQVITVLNGVIHCLLGYLLSFRELPAKVRIQVVDMKINGVGMETMKGVNSRGGRGYGNYQDRGDYGNYQEGGEYKNYQGACKFALTALEQVDIVLGLGIIYSEATLFSLLKIFHKLDHNLLPFLMPKKHVNGNGLFFQEASCIAEKSVIVADMEERVNRAVIPANQMAKVERLAK
ncbi:hypothetical protein Tco_1289380 [Tanacetum coccineum]